MASMIDQLPDHQAERWERAIRAIEALHLHGLLVGASVEVEGDRTRWAVGFEDGDGRTVDVGVPHPVGEPMGAYETAVELCLRPPVPLGELLQLALDFRDASLHVTDLVVERGRCRSVILDAPLTVTVLYVAMDAPVAS